MEVNVGQLVARLAACLYTAVSSVLGDLLLTSRWVFTDGYDENTQLICLKRCINASRRGYPDENGEAVDVGSDEASHEMNGPTFAHAIVTTRELIAALSEA
jgi:hypothetical protein